MMGTILKFFRFLLRMLRALLGMRRNRGVKRGYIPYMRKIVYVMEKGGREFEGDVLVPGKSDREAKEFFKKHQKGIFNCGLRNAQIKHLSVKSVYCYVSNKEEARAIGATTYSLSGKEVYNGEDTGNN